MQKSLTLSLLLLSHALSAMDNDQQEQKDLKTRCEIARIECLMYTNPEEALLASAVLASGKSRQEIKDLQGLDLSEIKDVHHHQAGNFINYTATLKDGDTICADFFVAGPMQGQYSCSRFIESGFGFCSPIIPLPNKYFHDLKKIYDESFNKKL